MIEVKNLNKKYGEKQVLSDINFAVRSGDIFGVMGRNGAGKTTLIKSILNETKFEGEIKLADQVLKADGRLDLEKVYFVSDSPHFYGYLTGIEYLQFVLKIKNVSVPPNERILGLLNFFGLESEDLYKLLKDYSFGMVRKLILAIGFLLSPKLMILDEPMIGLDVPSVISLKKLILESSKRGTTFFISSHDPSLMREICSSLMILHETQKIYYNPDFQSETQDLNDLYIRLIGENIEAAISSILD